RRASEKGGFLERAVALIHPQMILDSVVGDVNIDPAIAVEVGCHYSEGRPYGCRSDQGCRGDIDEFSASNISIQAGGLTAVRARRAIVAHTSDVGTRRRVLQGVVDVVTHEQIEPPVAIVVEERSGDGDARRAFDSALFRNVGKGAVAV